jgi:pimeloyl-ACP methyl ester carboxylesterase
MPKITLKNGVTLSYKEFGSGEKVLLSMQQFFLSGCHMELLGSAPYDYHAYLIMMPGYGESDHCFDPTPQDWVKAWGEDTLQFADAIGAERFYYTGISHGAWPGWYIAFHQPERLLGLAAVSSLPLYFAPGQPLPLPKLYKDDLVGNPWEIRKLSWHSVFPTKDPKRLARREACTKEHFEILMRRSKEEFWLENSSMDACEAASEEDFYDKVSKIDAPVLIFRGIHDQTAGLDKVLKVASLLPGAELITYQHYEHQTPDEYPELMALECDRFFKDIEGRIL